MTDRNNHVAEIERHGLILGKRGLVANGRWVRAGTADKPRSRNGSYKICSDGTLLVQNFATMPRPAVIRPGALSVIDPLEARKLRLAAEAEAGRMRREQETVAVRLRRTWTDLPPADPRHPYLVRKRIAGHGARQDGDLLVIPFATDGAIMTLQTIAADGVKRFTYRARKGGSYCAIGQVKNCIIVGEGFATMASIHEATRVAVACAGDAGNLSPVARHLRRRFPTISVIVAADNDANGVGQFNAAEAARAVNGKVVTPPRAGDDFNDIHVRDGLDAVRAYFSEVL